jgi:antitoxin component of MazEF toxin-antitoxin module
MLTARVTRWGNSLGIRIPKKEAMMEGIKEGDRAMVTKKEITAGDLVRRFGVHRSKKPIQRMVEEAQRGWNE